MGERLEFPIPPRFVDAAGVGKFLLRGQLLAEVTRGAFDEEIRVIQ